ncbi:putative quinate [Hortaea werneckii]|nr:putative quinate [Hortaea werneckii]
MGLLSLVEDRPTPKAVYNWRIGYDSAFIGTTIALDSFQDEFGFPQMSESEANLITSNIVSVYQAGAFFGALFAYVSAHWLGRKWSLIAWAVLFQIGAGIMLASNGSRGLGPIYAGRVIAGLAVGATSNITPIYISEISPPAVRGRLVGVYEVGWQVGGLVGFWINYGLVQTMAPSHEQWIIPFAVQLIPGGMLLIGAFWLRETPRWLMQKNRREEALKNLSWIRNLPQDDIYMVEEVAYIDGSLEEQAAAIGIGFWKPFKAVANNRRVQYRFILGSMLFLWQNGSGINAINYYSPTVFRSLGVDGDTTFLMTGIFGVVKTVITFFWLFFLIDNLGRRPLLMIGGYLNANPVTDGGSVNNLSGGGIAAIFFFYLWTAFYIPSWNGTPWVYNSEMFPQSVRSLGQAIAAASNWFWNFIIARFTPQMFSNMGPSGCGVYYFFASMMILSIIWVWFLMPETKGIPLESMDRLFQVRPPRKAHKQIHAEDEMREQEFRQDAEGAELSVAKDKLDHYEQRSPSE